MKRIFTTLLCALVLSAAFAQDRIGYVETQGILENLPEIKQIESELKTEEAQWMQKLSDMQASMEKLQQELQSPMLTPESKNNKQQSLQLQYTQYENQTKQAQLDLAQKSEELLAPIELKIQDAIAKVAEQKGYTYILNADMNGLKTIAYAKNDEDNITRAVVDYLKNNPSAPASNNAATTILKQP